ncbi:MAG: hypothetical protein QM636_25675 [Rhizobium sp.]
MSGAAEHPVAAYLIENKPLLARTLVRAFFVVTTGLRGPKFADKPGADGMVNMALTLL